MLSDRRILVTGATGQIAFPVVQELAKTNEVWGIARFSDPKKRVTWDVGRFFRPATRDELDAVGVITRPVDLADPDWSGLPESFDHVLHFAVFQLLGLDYDYALAVNAEGTGMLMNRFSNARSFLVLSTMGVYAPNPDPSHPYRETDPFGDQQHPHSPTYSISKISQEAVARTLARTLQLPTTIARMGLSYGANGGLPAYQLDMMLNGETIQLPKGGFLAQPIYEADINAQAGKLLDVASVPATIVNWVGDEVVNATDYLTYLAELAGVEPKIEYGDYTAGMVGDISKRQSLIGGCDVPWRDGMRAMLEGRHPDRVRAGASSGA